MRFLNTVLAILVLSLGVAAQSASPAIFFTDLTSAPNAGGETSGSYSGAYVALYGNNFGSSQGTSTVTWTPSGGSAQNCLRVVPATGSYTGWGASWLWYQKVVVQLGSSCTAGAGNFNITVNGQTSNSIPFYIGSGNIYCVSNTGSDSSGHGTFSAGCYRTLLYAKNTMAAGDVVYAMNGVAQITADPGGYGEVFEVPCGGTSWNAPKSFIAYPGGSASIGNTSQFKAIRASSLGCGAKTYVNISGFNIAASVEAISLSDGAYSGSHDFRLVADDVTCSSSQVDDACYTVNFMTNVYNYGMNSHNSGNSGSDKTYHSVYYSSDATHIDFGWNTIHDALACRALQFFSTGGSNQFDIHVHDNLIYNIRCDGINFATVDPTSGPVEAYNNVIYNVGTYGGGPMGGAPANCIRVAGGGTTNKVNLYNNTMYSCGDVGDSSAGPIQIDTYTGAPNTYVSNNIIQQTSGQVYTTGTTSCSLWSGGNNMWYGGSGSPPCALTGDRTTTNPLLTAPASANFHLQSGSPAIGAGLATLFPTYDHDGLIRSQPPSVGAYEVTGGSITRPNPPTNLTVVVQ